MLLKDIDFTKVQPVKKQCIVYAKDGNSIVKPHKALYPLFHLTHEPKDTELYLEAQLQDSSWEENIYYLYYDYGPVCSRIGRLDESITLEDLEKHLHYGLLGKTGFLECLKNMEAQGAYINTLDIELCAILGEPELAKHYLVYRDHQIEAREIKANAEREKYEAQQQEEELAREAELQKIIEDAEEAIRSKQTLRNAPFEGSTIVLYLMKKYQVKVPLKTQGWINKALAEIVFRDGKISYSYFNTSRDSTVFYKYLQRLEEKISQS